MQRSLARSSLKTIAIMMVRIAIQASTLIIVTRALGPTLYGPYVAVASLAVVLGLIPNLGAGYVLMAKVADNPDSQADTWDYGWPLSLTIGLGITIIFPVVSQMLVGEVIPLSDLVILGSAELLLTPLILLLSFMLQSANRVPLAQWVATIPLVLKCLAACVFVLMPLRSFTVFVVMQAIASMCGLCLAMMITSKVVILQFSPRLASRKELRLGANYAAMHLVAANPSEIDKITSPLLLGDHTAGIYSATSRIMNALVTPLVGVLLASQPRLFRHATNPTTQGNRLVTVLGGLSVAWGVTTASIMALLAPLLPRVFGPAYAETASLMPWVAIAAPFLSLRLVAGTVLVALGHPLQRLAFELVGVVLLVFSLTVGSRISGPAGMAVALAIAELSMCIWAWILVAKARRAG